MSARPRQTLGSDMDLTVTSPLDTDPDLASSGAEEGPAGDAGCGPSQHEARDRALDTSGPLWPLALNGWMSLDRLPARLMKAIRAHALAEAAAVPAHRSGAAP